MGNIELELKRIEVQKKADALKDNGYGPAAIADVLGVSENVLKELVPYLYK